jgi:hypothetical protein
MTMDDEEREFVRSLFAPDTEDKPNGQDEQQQQPAEPTTADFLHNLFHH